jgi:hypothetical protein
MRAADEDATVAAPRRIDIEHLEAIGDHVARFLERDRPDRRHGPELFEHTQHALRLAQHHRCERREAIQPLAPCRRLRPL